MSPVHEHSKSGIIARLMIGLIRGYQLTLSALIGRSCRHLPTCSQYTKEAVETHGSWAGFWLGLFRICRCNPWGTHGIDNVPEMVPRSDLMFWRYFRYGRKIH